MESRTYDRAYKQGKNMTKNTPNTMIFGQGVDLAGSICGTNWDSQALYYYGRILALTWWLLAFLLILQRVSRTHWPNHSSEVAKSIASVC
jgi:hypothetical protein